MNQTLCYADPTDFGNCISCTTDSDCMYEPGMSCFDDLSATGKGCACFAFFGYSGSGSCVDGAPIDDRVPTNIFIGGMIFAAALLFSLFDLSSTIWMAVVFHRKRKLNFKNPGIRTLFFAALSSLAMTVVNCGYVIGYLHLDNYMIFGRYIQGIALGCAGVCYSIATIGISVMWCDLYERSTKMTKKSSRRIMYFKNGTNVVLSVYSVIVIALMTIDSTDLAAMVNALMAMLILALYFVGSFSFVKALIAALGHSKATSSAGKRNKTAEGTLSVAQTVRRTANSMLASLVLQVGVSLVYSSLPSRPTDFTLVRPVMVALLWFAIQWGLHVCLYYIKKTNRRLFSRVRRRTSKPVQKTSVTPTSDARSSIGGSRNASLSTTVTRDNTSATSTTSTTSCDSSSAFGAAEGS